LETAQPLKSNIGISLFSKDSSVCYNIKYYFLILVKNTSITDFVAKVIIEVVSFGLIKLSLTDFKNNSIESLVSSLLLFT
jgi:hypothetical protein